MLRYHLLDGSRVNSLLFWEAGVFRNFLGLPLTQPDIEVLYGRELDPSDVLGCLHHPLLRLRSICGAFAIPRGDAASEDALDGAAVEPFEDLRAHAKTFQPTEGEETLL